jgi:hypothetical protein
VSLWRQFKSSNLADALRDFRAHWKLLTGVVLIVGAPVAILSTYVVDPTADSTLSAYLTFAQLVMNTALIYAVVSIAQAKTLRVREAYYQGSTAFVRLLLVWFLLVLISLLLLLGLMVIAFGLVAPGTSLALGEKLLILLLALIPTLPGLYLLSRTFMAQYRIYETTEGPITAIASAWRLSRGAGWRLLGRAVLVGLLLFLLLAVPAAVLLVLESVTGASIFSLLLQILLPLVILPVMNLYFFRLYQGLVRER